MDRVRQALAGRQELLGAEAERAGQERQAGPGVARQELAELCRRHGDRRRHAESDVAERHVDVECLEVRRMRQAQIERRAVGRRILPDEVGIVAVPRADLVEERDQVAVGDDLLARRSGEDAGGERGHQADDLRLLADGRCLVLGPQQARLFEGGQIQLRPRVGSAASTISACEAVGSARIASRRLRASAAAAR